MIGLKYTNVIRTALCFSYLKSTWGRYTYTCISKMARRLEKEETDFFDDDARWVMSFISCLMPDMTHDMTNCPPAIPPVVWNASTLSFEFNWLIPALFAISTLIQSCKHHLVNITLENIWQQVLFLSFLRENLNTRLPEQNRLLWRLMRFGYTS